MHSFPRKETCLPSVSKWALWCRVSKSDFHIRPRSPRYCWGFTLLDRKNKQKLPSQELGLKSHQNPCLFPNTRPETLAFLWFSQRNLIRFSSDSLALTTDLVCTGRFHTPPHQADSRDFVFDQLYKLQGHFLFPISFFLNSLEKGNSLFIKFPFTGLFCWLWNSYQVYKMEKPKIFVFLSFLILTCAKNYLFVMFILTFTFQIGFILLYIFQWLDEGRIWQVIWGDLLDKPRKLKSLYLPRLLWGLRLNSYKLFAYYIKLVIVDPNM